MLAVGLCAIPWFSKSDYSFCEFKPAKILGRSRRHCWSKKGRLQDDIIPYMHSITPTLSQAGGHVCDCWRGPPCGARHSLHKGWKGPGWHIQEIQLGRAASIGCWIRIPLPGWPWLLWNGLPWRVLIIHNSSLLWRQFLNKGWATWHYLWLVWKAVPPSWQVSLWSSIISFLLQSAVTHACGQDGRVHFVFPMMLSACLLCMCSRLAGSGLLSKAWQPQEPDALHIHIHPLLQAQWLANPGYSIQMLCGLDMDTSLALDSEGITSDLELLKGFRPRWCLKAGWASRLLDSSLCPNPQTRHCTQSLMVCQINSGLGNLAWWAILLIICCRWRPGYANRSCCRSRHASLTAYCNMHMQQNADSLASQERAYSVSGGILQIVL